MFVTRSRLAGALALTLLSACSSALRTTPAPAAGGPAFRAWVDSLATHPDFRTTRWGLLIVDPVRGDTLYRRDAEKLFMPASNQKLITGAVALAQLGPDYRWRTSFVATGPVREGVLEGNLLVMGSGDPSVSDNMRGDAMIPLREIADTLAARGIRRIRGRILAGNDAMAGPTLGFGWAYDDLDYPYSAATDELTFNEGFWRVILTARDSLDGRPRVTVRTAPTRRYPDVRIDAIELVAMPEGANARRPRPEILHDSTRPIAEQVVRVRGRMAIGDSLQLTIAQRDPSLAYLTALTDALVDRGIVIESRDMPRTPHEQLWSQSSPPLREVMPRFEKPSQNQIGELLFKTIGLQATGVGSPDSARAVVERQLLAWGAKRDGFAVRDGSGLSRHDYVSPETLVIVLEAMRNSPHFRVFYDALPIAGVDGTIASRMRDTPAQGNVRAKTGTVDKARSLSGYVTTADGQLLLFSFMTNNHVVGTARVDQVTNAIAARLAGSRLAELR